MEQEHYFISDLETGKLNIFTSRPFYDALGKEQKDVFRKYCLWSSKQECWVSKAKANNTGYLKARLKELGFSDKGITGERLPFTEQVEQQSKRAELRAENAETRAEKAQQRSDELYNRARDMAAVIPMGQPILVGHHSEKRDRNYRDRIHNTYGKAFEEQDKATYYADKAAIARETAEGKKYSNPKYLRNRIKEGQASIRLLERRLRGEFYTHSPEREIGDRERTFYTGRLTEEKEKLDFYISCMKKIDPDWQLKARPQKQPGKSRGL